MNQLNWRGSEREDGGMGRRDYLERGRGNRKGREGWRKGGKVDGWSDGIASGVCVSTCPSCPTPQTHSPCKFL